MIHWAVNIGLYQAGWFICVLGGNTYAWICLVLVAVHLYLSPTIIADLRLMVLCLLTGVIVDGALKNFGVMSFISDGEPIPIWLMMIWLLLGTLPHHSLSWMKRRYLLSAGAAAIGGPAAYWAGVRLGAASFGLPLWSSLLVLAVIWAVIWPLILFANDSFFSGKKW